MVKKMDIQEIKTLIESLRQSNPSLVNLSFVCDKLEAFISEAETSLDLSKKIDGLTVQIRDFRTVNKDLNERLGNVESVLKTQQDQLFLSDNEHKIMVKRVHTVLDVLEDYLRRHA